MALSNLENLTIPEAVKTQSRDGSGLCSCESESPCLLEQLVQREEFPRLVTLLHNRVWQRFSLQSNEDLCSPSDVQTGLLNNALGILLGNSSTSLASPACEKGPTIRVIDRTDTGHNTNITDGVVKVMGGEDNLAPERTVVDNGSTKHGHPDAANSCQLPAWFYLSAVFTGCPKLLNFLLQPQTWALGKENFKNRREDGKRSVNLSDEGTMEVASGHCSPHRSPDTPPDKKCSTPMSMNVEHKIAQETFTFDQVREKPVIQMSAQRLASVRVACEFPITDTWIHRSVNLVVSPLHLACWRHDYNAILTLLQHGADPNQSALEQVKESRTAPLANDENGNKDLSQAAAQQESHAIFNGLYFHNDKGLSPLHFIALGLRSPPRYSVYEGCKAGIIHDTSACFQEQQRAEISNQTEKEKHDMCGSSPTIRSDPSRKVCIMLTSCGKTSLEEEDEIATKPKLVVRCLEALLHAGARPNVGCNNVLEGAYPLDIVLQPPLKVYYAPSAARGNHSSVYLRMSDLEHNVRQVVAACDVLLRHDAKVSPTFVLNHLWRPELLDCFYLKDTVSSWQLVRYLIRLGIFSAEVLDESVSRNGSCLVNVKTSAVIQRFIADVMNRPVSASLTSLILGWCSVSLLHDVTHTVTQIVKTSGWNAKLRELADIALSSQLRSLKHSCGHVILKHVNFSFTAISCLPLPPPLKRELTDLYM